VIGLALRGPYGHAGEPAVAGEYPGVGGEGAVQDGRTGVAGRIVEHESAGEADDPGLVRPAAVQ
jgi:hypothetical protein